MCFHQSMVTKLHAFEATHTAKRTLSEAVVPQLVCGALLSASGSAPSRKQARARSIRTAGRWARRDPFSCTRRWHWTWRLRETIRWGSAEPGERLQGPACVCWTVRDGNDQLNGDDEEEKRVLVPMLTGAHSNFRRSSRETRVCSGGLWRGTHGNAPSSKIMKIINRVKNADFLSVSLTTADRGHPEDVA